MKRIHYFNIPETADLLPLYPISLGPHFTQGPIDRPDGYSGFQWLQTISGNGIFRCEDITFELPEGCGIFIDKETPHEYHSIENNWTTSWFVFDGAYAEKTLSYMELSFFKPYAITEADSFTSIFKTLSKLSITNTAKDFMEASTLLYNFLYDAGSSLIHTESTLFNKYKKLQTVIEFINQNYTSDISLDSLASLLRISPQHFCVLFKNITGLRPVEYINKVRLSRAKELLQGTTYPIEQIALMCGYDSSSYFFTLFKKQEGITPGAFRKRN